MINQMTGSSGELHVNDEHATVCSDRDSCERNLSVRISSELDLEWDAFVLRTSGGHHLQSSLWAQVKAPAWHTRRIVVSSGDCIVAGAQLMFRKIRFFGAVGYVPKGPLGTSQGRPMWNLVMSHLHDLVAMHRIRAIFVQPPNNGHGLVPWLEESGFQPSPIETAPTATVMVDLGSELDDILKRMKKGMRANIRRSQRRGIVVREGTLGDVATFHRLLAATASRRGFSPFPLDYFDRMWHILEPSGHLKLFISEHGDEPVSAQLVIPFGETVVAKQIGWSGLHGVRRPNEALDWATIQWAKAQGFTKYDLEGIEPDAARAIQAGQALPNEYTDTPTGYKLRFGGEVYRFPAAYCLISNSLLHSTFKRVGTRVLSWPTFQKAVGRFRTS